MDIIERQMKGAPLPNQVATRITYEVRHASGGLHTICLSAESAKRIAAFSSKHWKQEFEAYRVTTITEKL